MDKNTCHECKFFLMNEEAKVARQIEFERKGPEDQAKMLARLSPVELAFFNVNKVRPGSGDCRRYPKPESVSELYCCGEFVQKAVVEDKKEAAPQEVVEKTKVQRKPRAKKKTVSGS